MHLVDYSSSLSCRYHEEMENEEVVTEEEAVQYMRSVRDNGESSLRIYCSDALFDDLVADNAARFFGLLSREGFSGWTVSCAEPYRVFAAEGPK